MKDWRVWAFVIVLYLVIRGCGGCNGCGSDSNDDNSSEIYEQSSGNSDSERMYGNNSVSFNSEQDVRTYLCTHRFTSSDGYTISFRSNANELSVNGKLLTSYIEISLSSSSSVILRTHGPYGNTTFRLSVSGSDSVIRDSDGESYYSN